MKNKLLLLIIFLFICNCVGSASRGIFGTGVSVAFDPITIQSLIKLIYFNYYYVGHYLVANYMKK